ncbi:MAG: type II secretion system protein GspN [Nitrospirae bacterium]|nr:type II secretion system protein GspN [Nitrospirota bacterium]
MKDFLRNLPAWTGRFLRKQWKVISGYTLFLIAALLLFLYLTFPWSLLQERILYELARQTSFDFKAANSQYLFPLGIRLSGLVISKPDVPSPGQKTESKPLGKIDQVTLQIAPIDLLWGRISSSFRAEAFGGTLTGNFGGTERRKDIETEWEKVDLASIHKMGNLPIDLSGLVSGKGRFTIQPQGIEGTVRVVIDRGRIKDLKVMSLPLPELVFDQVRGAGEIKNNLLTFKEVKLQGEDLKGTIKGDVTFGPAPSPPALNLKFHIHLSERARSSYQGFLAFAERSRDREGYYNFSIKGTSQKPQISL